MLDIDDDATAVDIVRAACEAFSLSGNPTSNIDVLTAILAFGSYFAKSPKAAQRDFVAIVKDGVTCASLHAWAQKHLSQP